MDEAAASKLKLCIHCLNCMTQVRGKAMADKAGDLLELFHDVLLTARLDDKERFRQVQLPSPPLPFLVLE